MRTPAAREAVISEWMEISSGEGSFDRFDDLHIDKIDPAWADRKYWIEAGLESLRLAVEVRSRLRLEASVVLAFSLISAATTGGGDFASVAELENRLDWSPPSLYLFRADQEPWKAPGAKCSSLDPGILGLSHGGSRCYYLEFSQPEAIEHYRTVVVAA